ncbi:hypothetical protein N7457_008286 [Penicillium paradoxum]|uniref:uncharacterized protein n=1 Tax=Penicillium paradoxum TaxID=176176 RepID=UPI002546BCFB|nr:uncharacterized protein N7457_008286 [Penicillium paradoxum]KAJ5773390.1 hypothetical protein N7457_008286 [Penicillium paradoxum]
MDYRSYPTILYGSCAIERSPLQYPPFEEEFVTEFPIDGSDSADCGFRLGTRDRGAVEGALARAKKAASKKAIVDLIPTKPKHPSPAPSTKRKRYRSRPRKSDPGGTAAASTSREELLAPASENMTPAFTEAAASSDVAPAGMVLQYRNPAAPPDRVAEAIRRYLRKKEAEG